MTIQDIIDKWIHTHPLQRPAYTISYMRIFEDVSYVIQTDWKHYGDTQYGDFDFMNDLSELYSKENPDTLYKVHDESIIYTLRSKGKCLYRSELCDL